MSAATVSVVMPTYKRVHGLEQVLAPLLTDPAAHEIVVVVDGSRDGSIELLERIAVGHPRLRPMFVENGGEMAAREAGARAAEGDVVLFVDDDVLAEPGLVSGHAARHDGSERVLVLGYMPVVVPERRSPGDFSTRLYAAEYERRCEIYEREPVSVLRELWGGNFSMRRADCLAIGMRNADYTERYHPDRDFGIRCLEAGLRGVFDRSLRATHLHERSLPAFARDARSQGAGRVLMHVLHPATVPPLEDEQFARGVPAPARALVRIARDGRAQRPLAALLRGAVRLAGSLRLWPAQDAAARLLRRIEQQRGALDSAGRVRAEGAPETGRHAGSTPPTRIA
jgi:glycosyltransferase involved in cell wall biosynthesis